VSVLTRYLLVRMLGPLAAATLLFCGLIWTLQALRLGHHVLGAGLGAGLLLELLVLSLPALLTFALPLAVAFAVLYTLLRLEESNELLAMRSFGASPLQLALPSGLLSLGALVLTGLIAAHLEAPTLLRLEQTLTRGAAQALVRGPRPRRFHRLVGHTLYVEELRPGDPADPRRRIQYVNLLLAQQQPPSVLLARSAWVWIEGPSVAVLQLEDAELQMLNPRGGLRRIRFGRLEKRIDLGRALRSHLGFLASLAMKARTHRALTAPAACLALGLLATAIGLSGGRRLRLAALGLGAVAAFQLGSWSLDLLWPGPWGGLVLSLGVVAGSVGWLTRRSRRR
jgi:hypothetical protein